MSNNRQIAKNLIYNSLSFGLNLIISFFFTPYLITSVGKEAYGFYPLIENFIGYSEIIVAAVGSMAGRYITISYYKGDLKESCIYFNTVVYSYFILSALFTVGGIILVWNISSLLDIPQYLEGDIKYLCLFALFSLSVKLATANFGLGAYLKNRIDLQSSRKVLINIVRVLGTIFLFFFFKASIVFMSLAAFIAAIVGGAFDIQLKYKLIPEFELCFSKYFKKKFLYTLLSSGIWMSVNNLGNVLTISLDLLICNLIVGVSETGDFSISKTMPSLLLSVGAMLASTFTPHFNILLAKGQNIELLREINKSMFLITIITSFPTGYLMINSDFFLSLWVPDAYSDSLYILSVISIIPLVFGLCTNTLFDIFTITNKRKIPALALVITGVIHILLSFFLLTQTKLGVYAIALSGTITMTLRNLIFTPIYGAICLNEKWTIFYSVISKCLLCMVIVSTITFVSRYVIPVYNWLSFAISFTSVVAISSIVFYFILFDKQERLVINSIIKKIKK